MAITARVLNDPLLLVIEATAGETGLKDLFTYDNATGIVASTLLTPRMQTILAERIQLLSSAMPDPVGGLPAIIGTNMAIRSLFTMADFDNTLNIGFDSSVVGSLYTFRFTDLGWPSADPSYFIWQIPHSTSAIALGITATVKFP